MPFLSSHPKVPDPASVVTTPKGVTIRMRCPANSATITLSNASMVMPFGELKVADAPMPFVPPAVPFPASVDTFPDSVTIRMQLLPLSTTARFPLE